jgi:hypothetical protein
VSAIVHLFLGFSVLITQKSPVRGFIGNFATMRNSSTLKVLLNHKLQSSRHSFATPEEDSTFEDLQM